VILAYLPPYSPDYNPIEESFAQLKAWLQKNRELGESLGFKRLLEAALEAVGQGAGNHFRSCHIEVQEAYN
jgi:transposase